MPLRMGLKTGDEKHLHIGDVTKYLDGKIRAMRKGKKAAAKAKDKTVAAKLFGAEAAYQNMRLQFIGSELK